MFDETLALKNKQIQMQGELTDVVKQVSKMQETQAKMVDKLKNIEQSIQQSQNASIDRIQSMEQKIEARVKEFGDETKWSDIVMKHVENGLQGVSSNIDQMKKVVTETNELAAEERDKERRRNNIIMYRIEESEAATAEDRHLADMKFCLSLFNNVLTTGLAEEDIHKIYRLGKRGDGPRPLLVQLTTHHSKNLIMESLYKLKQAEQKYKQVVVCHDMTIHERDDCKALVLKAKELTADSGDYIYKVRGPPGQMKIQKYRV